MNKMDRKAPGWRRIVLPVSVILNLFFIAVIGGHFLRNGNRESFGLPSTRALANAEAGLPSQDAAAFGTVIRRDAPHYVEAERQLRKARQELYRQITADDFNEVKVRQALASWRSAWNRFSDDFDGTLVDALAQVSPEGRRQLVAARKAFIAGRRAASTAPASP